MVLVLLDLLLELIKRDLLVLNDKVDLELLDTETNGDELAGTPNKTLLLNSTDVSLKLLEVGLIICKQLVSGKMQWRTISTYPKA